MVTTRQLHDRPTAPLTGRWVELEPLRSGHLGELYDLIGAESMMGRWPRSEIGLSRTSFESGLWHLGNVNYVAIARSTGRIVGLVQGINEDRENGTVGLSVVLEPDLWRQGWPFEAVVLMLDLLFEWFGYRKVYCQFADSTRHGLFGAMGKWLNHEATLERHQRRGEQWEDWHIYSIFRRQWDSSLAARVTRRAAPAS